jgi:hypothetical protein
MRLHHALELIEKKQFSGLKHWPQGEEMSHCSEALAFMKDAAEFSLVAEVDGEAGLSTFQQFGRELWAAGLAQLPFPRFWISWSELTNGRDQGPTSLGALCVQVREKNADGQKGVGIYPMFFVPRSRSGFKDDRLVFSSRLTVLWLGESTVRVGQSDNTAVGMGSLRSAIRAVYALLGALGTPKAWRRTDPAPDKLNRARRLRGKPEIRSQIIIDLTPEKNLVRPPGSKGGWSVKPHWRRGHVRTLADGRRVPIPPACVNMDEAIPVRPEYLVQA